MTAYPGGKEVHMNIQTRVMKPGLPMKPAGVVTTATKITRVKMRVINLNVNGFFCVGSKMLALVVRKFSGYSCCSNTKCYNFSRVNAFTHDFFMYLID